MHAVNKRLKCEAKEIFGNYPAKRVRKRFNGVGRCGGGGSGDINCSQTGDTGNGICCSKNDKTFTDCIVKISRKVHTTIPFTVEQKNRQKIEMSVELTDFETKIS